MYVKGRTYFTGNEQTYTQQWSPVCPAWCPYTLQHPRGAWIAKINFVQMSFSIKNFYGIKSHWKLNDPQRTKQHVRPPVNTRHLHHSHYGRCSGSTGTLETHLPPTAGSVIASHSKTWQCGSGTDQKAISERTAGRGTINGAVQQIIPSPLA